MRVKASIIFLPLIALIIAGCEKKKPVAPRQAVKVTAIKVQPGESSESYSQYSGTLQAGIETPLSFTVAGTIAHINVEEGQAVSKGQTIATIDDSSLKNTLVMAEAEESQALDAQKRMKILHDAKALAEIKWVDIQAKVKQAKAATAIARRGLQDAVLSSPVSGKVAKKLAEPGQTAMPGVPVVTILSGNDLNAVVNIPENDINNFSEGQKAVINVQGIDYDATLTQKAIQADELTRAYEVKFRISDPGPEILPGMICTLKIEKESTQSCPSEIVLPIEAVMLKDDNSKMVWVIRQGIAEPRNVTTGDITSAGVVITSGLAAGDSVIIKGQQNVGAGTKVIANR